MSRLCMSRYQRAVQREAGAVRYRKMSPGSRARQASGAAVANAALAVRHFAARYRPLSHFACSPFFAAEA